MPKIPKWQNIIKVRTVEQINLLNTQYYKAKWLCMYHFATVITLTFTLHAYINILHYGDFDINYKALT